MQWEKFLGVLLTLAGLWGPKSGLPVPGLVLAAPICHGAQYCDEEGTAVVFGVLGDGL